MKELNKRQSPAATFFLLDSTDMLLLIWPCFSKPNLGFYSFEMAPVVVEFMSSNFSPGSIITFPMTCRCWMVANAWFAWWKMQQTSIMRLMIFSYRTSSRQDNWVESFVGCSDMTHSGHSGNCWHLFKSPSTHLQRSIHMNPRVGRTEQLTWSSENVWETLTRKVPLPNISNNSWIDSRRTSGLCWK